VKDFDTKFGQMVLNQVKQDYETFDAILALFTEDLMNKI
jgi:hypothetical protein